ncbi:MAG: hypothetical protein EP334_00540 [Gammaproteobacteria bacterium]|nr:MAG: hypothetical protein EP334_00540 [Gammaproteobacteria bacterium]
MKFFRVEKGSIQEGPIRLPKLWTDASGIQHPLTELWVKGHQADVIALGWLPGTSVDPVYDPESQIIDGEAYSVLQGEVAVSKQVRAMTQQELDSRLAEKRNGMVVSMRQARLALLQAGLLSQIDAAISSLTEPEKSGVSIEWEYAQEVKRHHAWVIALGQQLGLSDQQLDDLFAMAAAI